MKFYKFLLYIYKKKILKLIATTKYVISYLQKNHTSEKLNIYIVSHTSDVQLTQFAVFSKLYLEKHFFAQNCNEKPAISVSWL